MAADIYRRSDYGAWLIVIASILGLAVSVYNYNSADSGIAGTPGAMLVIVSTSLLLVAGFILGRDMGGGGLRVTLAILCFLGILGTGFASYLLESTALLVAMAFSLIGWLVRLFQPRPA
jgi:hypothetical protein